MEIRVFIPKDSHPNLGTYDLIENNHIRISEVIGDETKTYDYFKVALSRKENFMIWMPDDLRIPKEWSDWYLEEGDTELDGAFLDEKGWEEVV